MAVVTIDYETYYSTEYSLTRMSEVDYILDPRFETIMCAFKLNDGPTVVRVGHKDVAAEFAKYDWTKTCLCSHNVRFDGAIAAWRFGVNPALYIDTLSMARAMIAAKTGRVSLKAVSKYLGLPDKGTEIDNMRGKRLADFTTEQLQRAVDYCARDNDNCREIFNRLARAFPKEELRLVDLVTRMFIHPQVRLNPNVLTQHLAEVRAEKAQVMARVAHLDKSVFSSNIKFAELLKSVGVEPPMKTSPATSEPTYALAKNDRAFKEMCEDDTLPIEVQAILAARVNSKSTIEETRTEKMLALSLREWIDGTKGAAPVPIKFSGAHTHRLSGDGGYNFQNLKRGSRIREALVAPPGYRIVHRDASQIEARMLAFLARCDKLLTAFAEGQDVYSLFASVIYNRPVTKADKELRFVGKTCLAAGTRVLTNTGVVVIEDVTTEHLVWDGVEWVSHGGLIQNGLRQTSQLCGVSLTPDHRVWCGTTWQPASSLLDKNGVDYLRSALEVASSSLPGTCSVSATAFEPWWSSAIAAGPSTPSQTTTSKVSAARDVIYVPKKPRQEKDTGNMPKLCQTTLTAPGYSTVSLLPSLAVTVHRRSIISTTVAGAYQWLLNGALTARLFCATFRHCLGGMIPPSRWTERTPTGATSQATSGLSVGRSTYRTSAGSRILSDKSETLKLVYDIANAGPRHRFTILTDAGPLIVSNCILGLGYQTGAEKLRHTLFIGNGGVSVKVDVSQAQRWVYAYRNTYPEIPTLWRAGEDAIRRMINMARPFTFNSRALVSVGTYPDFPVVELAPDAVWLPSGLCVQYPELDLRAVPHANGLVTSRTQYSDGRGGFKDLYGGKFTENIDQALSRIVVMDAANRIFHETGQRPWLSTHDSLDYCVPENQAKDFDARLEYEFSIRPSWAPDLPLASEGGFGQTLADAEKMVNQ